MGFRGEALASMTYVAHVTVTTITSGQLHGYKYVVFCLLVIEDVVFANVIGIGFDFGFCVVG